MPNDHQPHSSTSGPADPDVTRTFQGSSSGSTIGNYRLLRLLGEGGMGVVYEAEQRNPRRPVALKVIRGGRFVHSEEVRLFQREAQALARLRHPGIAAIYETGQTDDGQHFLAMELVRGLPLSEWLEHQRADSRRTNVDVTTRLKLFLKICDAVNYAHQRAVIHRDLKPSNIVVSTEIGPGSATDAAVPEIKILDFGLARVTDGDVAGATVVTEAGLVRGTWAYMSPEQARGNPDEIDLRSDVYSLGVLLYELMTGALPLSLDDVSPEQRGRAISETTPLSMTRPRTYARAGKTRQTWTTDREVETITLKALEKDPGRRYQSASALAEDVRRYLDNQPILARPPSTMYQLRKLMSRHKTPVAFAAVLLIVVLVSAIALALQSIRLAEERDRALAAERRSTEEAETAQQVSTFLVEAFQVSDPSEARGNEITAREILDAGARRIQRELKDQPVVQARMMDTMGQVYKSLGLYDRASPLIEDALSLRRRTLGDEHVDVATSLQSLGTLRFATGDLEAAERAYRQALAIRRAELGSDHLDVAETENSLAIVLRRKYSAEGDNEAEQLLRHGLATRRRQLGGEHELVAQNLVNLGIFLVSNRADYAAAEPLLREALDMNKRLLGADHPEVGITLNNLALLLRDQERYDEAEAMFRQSLEIKRQTLGETHPSYANSLNNLANTLQRKGDHAGAEALYREAIDVELQTYPENHWEVANVRALLGGLLTVMGRYGEAEPLLLESYPITRDAFGDTHIRTVGVLRRIVDLYEAWGVPNRAAPYRALLPPAPHD